MSPEETRRRAEALILAPPLHYEDEPIETVIAALQTLAGLASLDHDPERFPAGISLVYLAEPPDDYENLVTLHLTETSTLAEVLDIFEFEGFARVSYLATGILLRSLPTEEHVDDEAEEAQAAPEPPVAPPSAALLALTKPSMFPAPTADDLATPADGPGAAPKQSGRPSRRSFCGCTRKSARRGRWHIRRSSVLSPGLATIPERR